MQSDVDARRVRPQPALLALVVAYAGIVLILPLAALLEGSLTTDIRRSITSLAEPAALSAMWNTFTLALIAVALNGAFGVAAAIVIVRHRFAGRAALDVLADLPLSVSPVMTGLGFVLLFGRG